MALTPEEEKELCTLLEFERKEILEKSLSEFAKDAWHVIEPQTQYIHGWHIDAICEHLQAVSRGEITKLLINIPPRHMKSILVNVMWPAWEWVTTPHSKWLFSSYAKSLTVRDSVKCRRLIESQWYQNYWDKSFRLTSDQNEKTRFENSKSGYRMSTSVGGSGTGEGGDRIVCDDPHKVGEAESNIKRASSIDWWNKEMSTRANDPKKSAHVVIMQRVHEFDLSGDILEKGEYEHLCIPARFNESRKCISMLGWEDPRKKDGELLWPERFDEKAINKIAKTLGSRDAAGQLDQDPAPADGDIFKREWWRYWDILPDRFDEMIQSWDMTFKDTKSSAYVVCQVWGRAGGDKYLIDQFRKQADFVATVQAFINMTNRHPNAKAKLVEDKANGPAVIATLRKEISGIIEYAPKGSKEARAHAQTPQIESGNVYLPNPNRYPWVSDMIERFTKFPNAKYKDEIDTATQALDWLSKNERRSLAMFVAPSGTKSKSNWM